MGAHSLGGVILSQSFLFTQAKEVRLVTSRVPIVTKFAIFTSKCAIEKAKMARNT